MTFVAIACLDIPADPVGGIVFSFFVSVSLFHLFHLFGWWTGLTI